VLNTINTIVSHASLLYAALVECSILVVYRSPLVKKDSEMYRPVIEILGGGGLHGESYSTPSHPIPSHPIPSQYIADSPYWLDFEEVREDEMMMYRKGIFSVYRRN